MRELLAPTLPSACYRVRCRVARVAFPSLPFFLPSPALRWGDVPPWTSLASLVYRGCPHCTRELYADSNDVYHSVCPACLALDDSRIASSDEAPGLPSLQHFFYRPFHVLVRDSGEQKGREDDGQRSGGGEGEEGVWLTVHHAVASRLFANLPASMWAEGAPSLSSLTAAAPSAISPVPVRRRRSKRLRAAADSAEVDVEDEALVGAMAETNAAEEVEAFCRGPADEAVTRRFCDHPRCQWMGLLCSLMAANKDEEGEGSKGRESMDCGQEWTMWVDVRVEVDDNEEMENRRVALLGCSMRPV